MPTVCLRFHGELEDFFPQTQRGQPRCMDFRGPQTLKHLVEAAGVPHVEVGSVQEKGRALPWDAVPRDGAHLDVHPRLPRARWPTDQPRPRFALDGHLGRLATFLRLLGFDTWYRNTVEDADLTALAVAEGRVVLTRDQDLLKRKILTHGYWVRNTDPDRQIVEILQRFAIANLAQPFTRCPNCNGRLQPVNKAKVWARLEPLTRRYYDTFYQCDRCGQVYWQGSHFDRLAARVQRWLAEGRRPT